VHHAIASTDCVPRPPSHGIVAGGRVDAKPRGFDPAGVLHATVAASTWTACRVATAGLHVFETLDWESTLVAGGRCAACAVAIDDTA
jgi:hypothetical protein